MVFLIGCSYDGCLHVGGIIPSLTVLGIPLGLARATSPEGQYRCGGPGRTGAGRGGLLENGAFGAACPPRRRPTFGGWRPRLHAFALWG
jgi:hypothetical protein